MFIFQWKLALDVESLDTTLAYLYIICVAGYLDLILQSLACTLIRQSLACTCSIVNVHSLQTVYNAIYIRDICQSQSANITIFKKVNEGA